MMQVVNSYRCLYTPGLIFKLNVAETPQEILGLSFINPVNSLVFYASFGRISQLDICMSFGHN